MWKVKNRIAKEVPNLKSKGCSVLLLLLLSIYLNPVYSQFTPGKLAVLVVGDGSGTLTSAATIVSVKEFDFTSASQTGTLVTALPSTAVAGTGVVDRALTQSGTATSEGFLNLSADRRFLTLVGYNTGAGTAAVTSTSAATFPVNTRVVGKIDANGFADTKTTLFTAHSGTAIRSAITVNGSSYWTAGAPGSIGIGYVQQGNVNAATNLSAVNSRGIGIFNNQLYTTTGAGSNRLAKVGNGLPVSGTQALVNLPGFLTTTGDPYSYVFIDLDGNGSPDVLYVASFNTAPTGLLKYTSSDGGTSWTARGSLSGNVFGVTGQFNPCTGNVDLYITANTINAKPNKLYKVTDQSLNISAPAAITGDGSALSAVGTLLATAASNTAFGGVAFTPGTLAPLIVPAITCSGSIICSGANNGTTTATVDNSSLKLKITAPGYYSFAIGQALFGPDVISNPVTGDIIYFSNPDFGCNPYPAGTFAGKVALIDRGTCFYELKAHHAQNAGAAAVIIVNNIPGAPINMGAVNQYAISIPVVMISDVDGATIKNLIAQPATVTGHTTNYSFLWSNGATTSAISGLSSGTYTVSVTADGSCISNCETQVIEHLPAPVNIIAEDTGSILCQGDYLNLYADPVNLAGQFNGINQWFNLSADITNLNNASFTLEAWVRTTGSAEGVLVSSDNDEIWEAGERALYIDANGNPAFTGFGNSTISSSVSVNDGNWHHIAVVRDYSTLPGTGRIYIDGFNRTATSSYVANAFPNVGTFSIGRPNYSEAPDFFTGDLDEMRIWNVARTAAEIQSGLVDSVSASTPGLLAYYRFDEMNYPLVNEVSALYSGTAVNNPAKEYAFGFHWLPGGETLPYISAAATGNYTVTVSDYLGCTSSSAPHYIKVIENPSVPVVLSDASFYFCSGDSVMLYTDTTGAIAQLRYGVSVTGFSSEFSSTDRSANQVLGAPNVYPAYGNLPGAWSGFDPDIQREYIQILYNEPAPVNFIDIYETYNSGAVDTVYVKNPTTGLFEVVYTASGSPQLPQSGKLHISFPVTTYNVAEIRIAINSPAVSGWNAIDAVGIGIEQTYLWSTGATTASIIATTGGTYSVSVSNGFCESVSVPVVVTVLPAPLLWNVDADGDTYGSTADDSLSCSQPLGFVLNTSDCDDASVTVYPGASEVCYNGIDDNCNGLTDEACNGTLNLSLLIEGYYNAGGTMVPALFNAGMGFSTSDCDSVTIELRKTSLPSVLLSRTKMVMNTMGSVSVSFPDSVIGQNGYIVILHRNAVQTWSNPVTFTAATNYNFTTAASQAYGANQREVEPGIWAFYSGDIAPQDEVVDITDQGLIGNDIINFAFGYVSTDVSGDGVVDITDQAIVDNNILNFVGTLHP
jgi:hypothetical protein